MTPELNCTLTAMTQIFNAHSIDDANNEILLSSNDYNDLVETLAQCPHLATLTTEEWITFYDALPNRINTPDDDGVEEVNGWIVTDKTTFLYEVLIYTPSHRQVVFLPLIPTLLTRLQTQHDEVDEATNEDDYLIIRSIEDTLTLLISHAVDQENLHQWFKQSLALLDVSATLATTAHNILSSLACQIVSLPNSLGAFKTYLNTIKVNESALSEEQRNGLYRGYAIIAINDSTWGWNFFKEHLEQSLPLNAYPPTQVTQLQTLLSLVPFLSPTEQQQRWNQIFTQLQTSTETREHGSLCSLLVRLLIRLFPYLASENRAIVRTQVLAVINNPLEIAFIKVLMKRLLTYTESVSLVPMHNALGNNPGHPYAARLAALNVADTQAVSHFFYDLIETWRDISEMLETNIQDLHPNDQEQNTITIIRMIREALTAWGQLFPYLETIHKHYFWHTLRAFLFCGFQNIEMAGQVRTTVVNSLYCLAPQLFAEKDKSILQQDITLFRCTLHAALLCLSHPPEDDEETTIPHIMSESMHTHLVSSTYNALAAAIPYIPTELQWNDFRQELASKSSYTFIRHQPIFTLATATFSPATLPHLHLDKGLARLRNKDNYQSPEQARAMANDLLAYIFWPPMYTEAGKAVSNSVCHSLQKLLTHPHSEIQKTGLAILNQWIEHWIKPLVSYQSLASIKLKQSGNMIPIGVIVAHIALPENRLVYELFKGSNEMHVKCYHDHSKMLFLRLLLSFKAQTFSPILDQAIQRIEECWKQQASSQASQTLYNNSKKRVLSITDNNSDNYSKKNEFLKKIARGLA